MTRETASCEKIQQLEKRHVQLIDELDLLNSRLEQTLRRFARSTESSEQRRSNAES